MFSKSLATLSLLSIHLSSTFAHNSSSTTACNNSPSLCNQKYNEITYLGAHDSPFLRDESTGFSESGNQFYNSTVQLSAGVRLLTAQVQNSNGHLHVCHSLCELLDAGPLSSWLREVRTWIESNPNEVVTILLVNGVGASAQELAAQYEAAGITSSLAYAPSGSTSQTQEWPTLESLISSGTRLLNFVDSIGDTSAAPYIMPQYSYMFQNNYQVTSLDGFNCTVFEPSNLDATQAISDGMMPLMNHMLYQNDGFGIQSPAEANITTTNSPNSGVGTLGSSATQCTQEYGRAPSYILVDFFNVGPAIATVDRLNNVTNPVGRTKVPTQILTATSGATHAVMPKGWKMLSVCLTSLIVFVFL